MRSSRSSDALAQGANYAVSRPRPDFRAFRSSPTDAANKEVLYHYTTPEGLLGILGTGKIRASDARHVNDSAELEYGKEVVRRVIEKRTDAQYAQYVAEAIRNSVRLLGMYMLSLSENPDVLSQWRAYANDGLGYSIGLDPARPLVDPSGRPVIALKVLYNPQEQDRLVEQVLDPALTKLAAWGGRRPRTELVNDMVAAVQHLLPILKNPGFAEEEEWRCVIAYDLFTVPTPSGFRATRFGISGFLDLKPEGERFPLKAVCAGPRIAELNTLAEFLWSLKYPLDENAEDDVLIAHSATSYR